MVLEFRQSGADGEAGEVREVGDVELGGEILAMNRDGLGAEAEFVADDLGAFALSEQGENLALAGGEQGDLRERFGLGERRGHDGCIEASPAGRAGGDRGDKPGEGVLFHDITGDAGGAGFADEERVAVARKHDDRCGEVPGAQLAGGVDAVQLGHREVDDDDIGLQFEGEAHGFVPVLRFGDDGESRLFFEE